MPQPKPEQPKKRRFLMRWLPTRRPKSVGTSQRSRDRRSDIMTAALGLTLGLICALFPWYIFFNQDQFGIRAMRFQGSGPQDVPTSMALSPERVGAPMQLDDFQPMGLDLFATGTTGDDVHTVSPDAAKQPFPEPTIAFKLVHVANGRAMIADDAGLFVVQRGSILPDNSRVASIEMRSGKWVLVTSRDRVLELVE
jgi:hypothetical protein